MRDARTHMHAHALSFTGQSTPSKVSGGGGGGHFTLGPAHPPP